MPDACTPCGGDRIAAPRQRGAAGEKVALTQRPEPVGSRGGDGSVQHLLEQHGGLRGRQGLELEPGKVLVLPQGGDGVRRLLTGPQGDQDSGSASHSEVVHHHRRSSSSSWASSTAISGRGPKDEPRVSTARRTIWAGSEPRSPSSPSKAPSGVDLADAVPYAQRVSVRCPPRASEPLERVGLADPGGAREHGTAATSASAALPRKAELLVPTDERPCSRHGMRLSAVRGLGSRPAWRWLPRAAAPPPLARSLRAWRCDPGLPFVAQPQSQRVHGRQCSQRSGPPRRPIDHRYILIDAKGTDRVVDYSPCARRLGRR